MYVCGALGSKFWMFCCFVLLFVFVYISCCYNCPIISFFCIIEKEKSYTGFSRLVLKRGFAGWAKNYR
jgi:hypothetical protein